MQPTTILPIVVLALSTFARGASQATPLFVTIDCKNCPESCNNDCFAIYNAKKPSGLNYVPKINGKNRIAAGCTKNPCNPKTGNPTYRKSGNGCDEYPYASTTQGGPGAILRCVARDDNKAEGDQLGAFYKRGSAKGGCNGKACSYALFLKNYSNKTPYCTAKAGSLKNDGYEFTLKNGKFINARGEDSLDLPHYGDVVTDPSDYVPVHLRREFELDDGSRVLLLAGDIHNELNGTMVAPGHEFEESRYVVRELFGMEKSEWFQPPVGI